MIALALLWTNITYLLKKIEHGIEHDIGVAYGVAMN